jgi:hypothetical protein
MPRFMAVIAVEIEAIGTRDAWHGGHAASHCSFVRGKTLKRKAGREAWRGSVGRKVREIGDYLKTSRIGTLARLDSPPETRRLQSLNLPRIGGFYLISSPRTACPLSRKVFGYFPSPQILNDPKSLNHSPSGASGSDSRHCFSRYKSSGAIFRSAARSKRWSLRDTGRLAH